MTLGLGNPWGGGRGRGAQWRSHNKNKGLGENLANFPGKNDFRVPKNAPIGGKNGQQQRKLITAIAKCGKMVRDTHAME